MQPTLPVLVWYLMFFISLFLFWPEPSSGGGSSVSASGRQLATENLHQDIWSNGYHDSHRQGDGTASGSASGPAQQHDHGTTHTHTHTNQTVAVVEPNVSVILQETKFNAKVSMRGKRLSVHADLRRYMLFLVLI